MDCPPHRMGTRPGSPARSGPACLLWDFLQYLAIKSTGEPWPPGWEHELWSVLVNDESDSFSEFEIEKLKSLQEDADGWWYEPEPGTFDFISTNEWCIMYASLVSGG